MYVCICRCVCIYVLMCIYIFVCAYIHRRQLNATYWYAALCMYVPLDPHCGADDQQQKQQHNHVYEAWPK